MHRICVILVFKQTEQKKEKDIKKEKRKETKKSPKKLFKFTLQKGVGD